MPLLHLRPRHPPTASKPPKLAPKAERTTTPPNPQRPSRSPKPRPQSERAPS